MNTPDYEKGYLFLIKYLQDHIDKIISPTDFNFVKEYLLKNCRM